MTSLLSVVGNMSVQRWLHPPVKMFIRGFYHFNIYAKQTKRHFKFETSVIVRSF